MLSQLKLACVQTSPLPQEKSGEETSSPLPIFPKGGGTSVHRLIKIDCIYSRTPYAFIDYDRHYRLDDRTVFSDRSPRPDTVQEAKFLLSHIRLYGCLDYLY